MSTRKDPIALLGRAKFLCCVLQSTLLGLLGSSLAGTPGLPCDLRNPLLKVLEQARFLMQAQPRRPAQEKRAALLQYFRTIPHNRTAGVLPAQPLQDESGKLFLTDPHR